MTDDRHDPQHQFQAIKTDAQDLLRGLSDTQLNWHPSVREWSIAECVEHLVVTGRGALSRIDQVTIDPRSPGFFGQGPFRYRLLERWIVFLAEAPWRTKFKAPKGYVPSTARPYAEVASSFFAVQDEFIESLRKAQGIDLSKTKVPNPVTKWFTLSLGQYLVLHAAHERRHLRQVRQIKADPHFPCAT
ncbi:MAG: DinB family protein [Gammaproteobacteria bacterium]